MVEKRFKVYGASGHRQRESFDESYTLDFSEGNNVRIIEVRNSDVTGTNEYSVIDICRNTIEEVYAELEGQLSDGIFENCTIGRVEEVEEGL